MKNRVVMVTGAFGTLGRGVCAELNALGASLALVDAAPTVPPDIAAVYSNHLVLPGVDLSNGAATDVALHAVQSRFGGLDGVVNVAGGFRWETIADGSSDTWDFMYVVNVKTALNACRAALPLLKARGAGRIVNIGAASAAKAGLGMGAYAASKSGVQRLTESLAEECKADGITVNAILPSIIDTPANRKDMPDADPTRWVTPDDIAHLVSFLLSDDAKAISGASIPVQGRA